MRPVLLVLCMAATLLSGCGTVGASRWYAPATWFKHAPADKADKAHAAEVVAEKKADVAADNATHAAQLEFTKVDIAAAALPPSRATDLVRRFNSNGLGLLDQVRPLTAAESADLRALVAGLLSDNAATVAAAERLQAQAESEATRLSNELTKARTEAAAAALRADNADAKLRAAFDRENALANDLRAQRARFWLAIGGLVVVAGFAAYAYFAFGGIGAALHAAGAPAAVVGHIDSNLSTFGQWMIRRGRLAAAKAEAVLAAKVQP